MHPARTKEEYTVTLDPRPRARPEVDVYVFKDASCLLFDPRANDGHVLDAVAALIWDYCDGVLTVSEIAAEIAALVPQHVSVEEHVLEFVQDLARRNLLLPPSDVPTPR